MRGPWRALAADQGGRWRPGSPAPWRLVGRPQWRLPFRPPLRQSAWRRPQRRQVAGGG